MKIRIFHTLFFSALEAFRNFGFVLSKLWRWVLLYYFLDALTSEGLRSIEEAILQRGREDLPALITLLALNIFSSLFWVSLWTILISCLLALRTSFENQVQTQTPPEKAQGSAAVNYCATFALHQNFGQILIESIRSYAAIVWRLPLLILPALFEYIRLFFVPYLVLFDGSYHQGEVDVLKRSRQLARRNWIVIGMAQTLVLGLLPLLLHLAFQSPSLSKSPLQFVVVHTLDVALAIWSFLFLFFIFKTIVSGQGLNLEAGLCTSPSGLPLTETNSKEIPNADVQLEKN